MWIQRNIEKCEQQNILFIITIINQTDEMYPLKLSKYRHLCETDYNQAREAKI